MGRSEDDAIRRRHGANAFDPLFLASLDEVDEPATAVEAEFGGPWWVAATARGHAVLREGETAADEPEVLCEDRQGALLAAAVLPAVGRDALYRLREERGPAGRFELRMPWGERGEVAAGSLRLFVPEVARALHVAGCLVRSPASLAALLEAAGATALGRAGTLLSRRVEVPEQPSGELLERAEQVFGLPRLRPRDRERLEELAEEWRRSLEAEEEPLPRIARRLQAAAESLRRTGTRLLALSEDSDALRARLELKAAYLADLAGACGTLALEAARRLEEDASPDEGALQEWRQHMEELDRRLSEH